MANWVPSFYLMLGFTQIGKKYLRFLRKIDPSTVLSSRKLSFLITMGLCENGTIADRVAPEIGARGRSMWEGTMAVRVEEIVEQSFEQLREPILRYLIGTFGDPAAAEEITQDVFLRLYSAMISGQQIQNVKAWVFRVAHNLAINASKKQQFIQPVSDEMWDRIGHDLRSEGNNPEQDLLRIEKFRRLRMAIGRLTTIERSCLNLRTKGFQYREIGEILEMSTTSVAETLYRVVDKLGKQANG